MGLFVILRKRPLNSVKIPGGTGLPACASTCFHLRRHFARGQRSKLVLPSRIIDIHRRLGYRINIPESRVTAISPNDMGLGRQYDLLAWPGASVNRGETAWPNYSRKPGSNW
jgi:hypothetical protein